MVITWENIDDILEENGLIKEGFNKRLKIGTKWLGVYDRNLEKIYLVTSYVINNGRDKKAVALLGDCIAVARDIIAMASRSADASDIIREEKKVRALEKSEPVEAFPANIHSVVRDCLKDTAVLNAAVSRDLEGCDEEQYKIIRDVYRRVRVDEKHADRFGFDAFKEETEVTLREANQILSQMTETTDTVLDDSSQEALGLAAGIVEDLCAWRNAVVYSYLDLGEEMLRPLRDAERWLSVWNKKVTGVEAKKNPRVSSEDIKNLADIWKEDQGTRYVAEAKKRGAVAEADI